MTETPPEIRGLPSITKAHEAYYDLMTTSPKTQKSQEQMQKEIQSLFKNGLKANGRDQQGNPPLHLAARYGYIYVVDLLLIEGADPKAEDGDGFTTLERIDALIGEAKSGQNIYNEGTILFCSHAISAALKSDE